ncbi:MAG: porin [Betaproteobacteria bacterium]
MQKRIIALAVAGLVSGAAFAQSNVTIYGVMDAYAGYGTAGNAGTGDQKQIAVNSGGLSSSRLGFKGEEALGNGLKAIFTLELGSLDITGATNSIGNTRQAYVGLTSDKVGTAYLGRVQTLGYDYFVKYDSLAASNAFSPLASLQKGGAAPAAAGTGSATGQNFLLSASNQLGRQSNAIAYISPSFAGVTIRANAATGTNQSAAAGQVSASGEQTTGVSGNGNLVSAQSYFALGGDYDNGPLSVGAAYAQANHLTGSVNNAANVDVRDWALSAKYDFKVVQPFVSYQESRNTNTGTTNVKNKLFGMGLAIPVGSAGAIKLAYANFRNDLANQVKAQGYAVDYEHSLSKRTTAYVGWQQINNGSYGTFGTANANSTISAGASGNVNFYGTGVRHTF